MKLILKCHSRHEVCLCLSVCLSVCLSLFLSVSLYLCLCLSVSLSVSLSLSLSSSHSCCSERLLQLHERPAWQTLTTLHLQIGRAPVHMAAFNGHAGVIRLLLSHRSMPTNAMMDNCISAARLAATMGHKAVAEVLSSYYDRQAISQEPNAEPPALRLRGGMMVKCRIPNSGTLDRLHSPTEQCSRTSCIALFLLFSLPIVAGA